MAEEKQHRKGEAKQTGTAETTGVPPVRSGEGGRRTAIESSPEERLMQVDSASAGQQEGNDAPSSAREASLDEIDERHGADARMEVRRREHSAD